MFLQCFPLQKEEEIFYCEKISYRVGKKNLANLFSANPTFESFSEWKDIFGNDRKCFIFASFTKK